MTPMIEKLKETKNELESKDKTTILMDAGYENEIMKNKDDDELEILVISRSEASKENKRKNYIKKRVNKNKIPEEGFNLKDFKYDATNDICICPLGQVLS